MPMSERKLAANRANAKRSTGPRTRRGKATASLNALVHGLAARTQLLPGEDEATFRRFVRRMLDELRPDGALQEDLAAEVIQSTWKLRRVPGAESAMLVEHHAEKEEAEANGGVTRNSPLKVLCNMITSKGVWSGNLNSPLWTLDRYALRIEPARALALRMLLTLQKRKR